ncbi:MAG: hypothetical protein ABI947_02570 [Chloroflexota bacterium]
MIIIPVGRILKLLFRIEADERQSKTIFYLLAGALLYAIIASILFVVLGEGRFGSQGMNLAGPCCGSSFLVVLGALGATVVVASQKSVFTSSATWLTVSDAAKYLGSC